MGLHKYQINTPFDTFFAIPFNTPCGTSLAEREKIDALNHAILNYDEYRHKTLGGYDGGVEVGFKGDWQPRAFAEILEQLGHAQQMAQSGDRNADECYVILGGRMFLVESQGCKVGKGRKGIHYRYRFTGDGVSFYVHHNPAKNMQPVRLRYNHDALVGRDLFTLHETTLDWLDAIGFKVEKETVSRVDLQITIQRPIADFMDLIARGHAVMKSRKRNFHENCGRVETYTIGTATQLCIYDKKRELENGGDEIKTRLVVKHLLDLDLPEDSSMFNAELYLFEDLTRIEFRLRRDRLKEMGIDTIADLKEKELSMIAFMTEEWFRILDAPKVRGHENEQQVHPLWQEVQQLFARYFPGDDVKRSEIKRGRDKSIKCSGESLFRQSDGCIESAYALLYGSTITEEQYIAAEIERIKANAAKRLQAIIERAKEIEVTRGVTMVKPVQNATSTTSTTISPPFEATKTPSTSDTTNTRKTTNTGDWHLDPKYALNYPDESYLYERFVHEEVAGCPF